MTKTAPVKKSNDYVKKKAVSAPKTANPSPSTGQKSPYDNLNIGREFIDVTWRMAVPVILFAGLGLLADKAWETKPWLTLLGTLIGFFFAALLVKRQIGVLPQDDPDMIEISRAKRKAEKDNNEDDDEQ